MLCNFLESLVNVAGQCWKVEECFELAKDEVGLVVTNFALNSLTIVVALPFAALTAAVILPQLSTWLNQRAC
ncbi:MAG: hypothetical protein ABI947_12080 [Chloroflexota bacterium]